jgi:hypothetical protein
VGDQLRERDLRVKLDERIEELRGMPRKPHGSHEHPPRDRSAERVQAARARAVERQETARTDRPLPDQFDTKLVGVSFARDERGHCAYPGNVQELEALAAIRLWRDQPEPIACVLIRRPDNPHDSNAIEVHVPALAETEAIPVGFLPRVLAARLAPELDDGVPWQIECTEVATHPDHPLQPGVHVALRRVDMTSR